MLERLKKILWLKHYNQEITSLHLFSSALILVLAAGLSYILIPSTDSLAASVTTPNIFGRITYSCTDRDGGKKQNTKSITTSRSSRGNVVSIEDRCLNENVVLESYCAYRNSPKPSQVGIRCSKNQICQDGACIVRPTMASSTYSCIDSDSGDNLLVAGSVTVKNLSYNTTTAYFADTCVSDTVVREGSCALPNDNTFSTDLFSCDSDQTCHNGACVSLYSSTSTTANTTSTPRYACVDSDGGQFNKVKGTTTIKDSSGKIISNETDRCVFGGVYENYCDASNTSKSLAILMPCDKGSSCQDGACIPTPKVTTTPKIYSCTDSDGGSFKNIKGVATIKNYKGEIVSTVADRCVFGGIVESSCDSPTSSEASEINYTCDPSSTCQDGACVPSISNIPTSTPPTFSCTDSDGGVMKSVAGTTVIRNLSTNSVVASFSDSCFSTTMINEGYCSTANADMYSSSLSPCNSNQICQNGACVSRTPVSTTTTAPFVVMVTGDSPTAGGSQSITILAGTQLGRFKITNNGNSKVTITDIKLTDNGSHTGTPTYRLRYSDQNSTNYTQNSAVSSANSVDFSSLGSGSFSIDGGAYRYVTVTINTTGGIMSGDFWQLAVTKLGNISYSATETDLGYDANGNGTISDTILNLPAEGIPALGTIVKQ